MSNWFRTRKAIASTVVIAVLAGVPLTIAALHPGFPVSDVELTSRDVWVTNGAQLLGGRLNRQIDELNGSVVASSADFTVLQDGDTLFMYDPASGKIESVNPASTKVTSAIDVPKGSEVGFGGTTLSILSPKGDLWLVSAVGDLQFNYVSTAPSLKLGTGAHAVVTHAGEVIAVSPTTKSLYRLSAIGTTPEKKPFPAVGSFQLTAVGDAAVVFDQSTNSIVSEGGVQHRLPERGLRLQQVGLASATVVVASGDSLLKMNLDSGDVETIPAGLKSPATRANQVSAPVFLDGCAHGAWASEQRYLLSCDGKKAAQQNIEKPTQGNSLEFRVNRSVIVLNDLTNGNTWVVSENMRLVENWSDVTPPEEKHNEQTGDTKSATQSFKDTLAQRTDVNRPPVAVDDNYGIRPGRTTILSVLDNDSDPDGDVLVISAFDKVAESTGKLEPIDGNRALQFTPTDSFVGSISFTYTVNDGRGGTAQASVTARVVPNDSNQQPIAIRAAAVSVEANQTVSYNVLTDWKDPDGDDIYLVGASPKSGDLVRFTPDGFITFTHQTAELGQKEVTFLVSDGHGAPVPGTLTVDVQPAGSLDPIGTPDFATSFSGETAVISPLLNDISPSGAQLSLIGLQDATGGAVASFNADKGTINFSSAKAGVFYLKYTLGASQKTSIGLVRIDVVDKPSDDKLPPIAVKDTAYLRGDQPTIVAVLANDVSPSGRILAVQSVSVDPIAKAKGLVVELLGNNEVRVTSPAALTQQANFSYTISDGFNSATAGVTVVPVPPLTKHQPPVAANDVATVRAGDIVTVPVLKNDFHPDGAVMTVDSALVTSPSAGIAFVDKNTVRYQAPTTPGEYRLDYRVTDPYSESATATVTFTVTAIDQKANRSPVPTPIVGRVIAGGQIRVDVPLDGIDPDGDSVQLLGFPTSPVLGAVTTTGTNYFIYTSSKASTGTDTFTYQVYDAFGATGQGEVKIAVIPAPSELALPVAVPDTVSIRPGRVAQTDLLANDSDPQGATIKASKKLLDVPKGIDARVIDGRYLVVTAPTTEQTFSLRYQITNNRGGSATSYVIVKVTKDAPILPPVASDYSIKTKDIAGKKTVKVELFPTYAYNPSGETNALTVTFDGPNAKSAANLSTAGQVEVTPGVQRQAIAYRVTNEVDKLSAMGFILVPALVSASYADPPVIDPNLPIQYVPMNTTRSWNLSQIVKVPSGRQVWMPSEKTVTSQQSNGAKNYGDKTTLTFTPAKDYRGPASINFTVTDGDSLDDPKGIKANLRLNIVVGDPEFRDTPPEFTSPETQVEVGESTTIDLRSSTAQPNPQILSEVTYSDITGGSAKIVPTLNGSQLTISTPRNTPKGTTGTLGVTLRWDKFVVQGTIKVTVVGSTRPLAVAVDDNLESQRGDAATVVNPLTNDSNPFQSTGEPLTIVAARVQNTGEPAEIKFTDNTVTIAASPTLKNGDVIVVYTIEDGTRDKDREVNGTIKMTVSDVPDMVQKPTRDPDNSIGGDQTASFRWQPPATNGKPITGYAIAVTPGSGVTVPASCTTANAVSCTLTGLANGTAYSISVRAINQRGPGAWSPPSDTVTPYGTPSAAAPTMTSKSGWSPDGDITWSWPPVAATGGSNSYKWTVTNVSGAVVKSGSGPDLTSARVSSLGADGYSISVTVTNSGGKSGPAGTNGPVVIESQTRPSTLSVTATVTGGIDPGTIRWDWSGAGSGAQVNDNLVYYYSIDGAGVLQTTTTTVTRGGLGAGNHSLTVYAKNNAGSGGSGSASADIAPQPRYPQVSLSPDPANNPSSSCQNGHCHKFHVTLSDFANNDHNIVMNCMGATRTESFSGNDYTSNYYCGYRDTYATVDGYESNHVNFNF